MCGCVGHTYLDTIIQIWVEYCGHWIGERDISSVITTRQINFACQYWNDLFLLRKAKVRWNAGFIRTLYSSNRNSWPQYCNEVEMRDAIFILGLSILSDRAQYFATTRHHFIRKTHLSKHESYLQWYTPDVVFRVRKGTLLLTCSTVRYKICQMRNISPNT